MSTITQINSSVAKLAGGPFDGREVPIAPDAESLLLARSSGDSTQAVYVRDPSQGNVFHYKAGEVPVIDPLLIEGERRPEVAFTFAHDPDRPMVKLVGGSAGWSGDADQDRCRFEGDPLRGRRRQGGERDL